MLEHVTLCLNPTLNCCIAVPYQKNWDSTCTTFKTIKFCCKVWRWRSSMCPQSAVWS